MHNDSSFPGVDPYNWSYAESPDISESVYIAATVYLVTTVLSNFFLAVADATPKIS